MKIVLNGCYGGFGLSYEAMFLYLHAKHQEAIFYADVSIYDNYTKVHKYQRVTLPEIRSSQFYMIYCTTKDQGELIHQFPEDVDDFHGIDRTDPILISIIETIGAEAASDIYSQLEVHDIPDGTLYKIDEYDGLETIITQDDDDWKAAISNYISIPTQTKIEQLWATIKPESAPDPDLTFKEDN